MKDVSIIKNKFNVRENASIKVILNYIQNGKYREPVLEIRKLIEEKKENEAQIIKDKLDGFTPSGTFYKKRDNKHLDTYSQLISLDIDTKTKEEAEIIKNKISKIEYTLAVYYSCTEQGVHVIIRVNSDEENHNKVYNQIVKYYEERIGIKVDNDPSITHSCFFSFDTRTFINYEAKIFGETPNPKSDKDESFEKAIRITEKKHQYISSSPNNYVSYLAYTCNRLGIEKKDTISMILERFDYEESKVNSTVRSAYKRHEEFNQYNVRVTTTPAAINDLETFLKDQYDFRYNVVKTTIEFRPKEKGEFIALTDFWANSIWRSVRNNMIETKGINFSTTLMSDFSELFDPFKSFLESLMNWDESQSDYIDQLASTVKTDDDELWRKCLKKWMVAMVASLMVEKESNDTVLVFSGRQGLGKTRWFHKLQPRELHEYYFSGTLNPGNKDSLFNITECNIINMDEFENLNKTEIGTLKSLITEKQIRQRRPYARYNETFVRRASFVASVNTVQFLNDPTGNRRFLCFITEEINYEHGIDMKMVYAQAIHLFKTGFKYYFSNEEIEEINQRNEQFQVKTPHEEMVLKYLEPATRETADRYWTSTEILDYLAEETRLKSVNYLSNIIMGKVLHKLGFEQFKKLGRWVYSVKIKSALEINKLERVPRLPSKNDPNKMVVVSDEELDQHHKNLKMKASRDFNPAFLTEEDHVITEEDQVITGEAMTFSDAVKERKEVYMNKLNFKILTGG